MRIAHVLSSLDYGGQERIALDLAVGQRDAGHEVIIVTLDDGAGPLRAEFNRASLEVLAVPKAGEGFDTGLWRRLGALFRERRLELVHTHNPLPLYYAAVPARATRAALVHTKHGINPTSKRRTWMRRGFGLLVDAFVCVSESTAEVARREHECRRRALHVILNGTDLSRFGPDAAARAAIRDELGIPSAATVVGTVGRIYPEKAHPFLIDSLLDLLGEDLHIVIVGTGPKAEALAEKVASLPRPDAVHLTGIRRDVPQVLCALDVFALPSLYEGLPLVIPEAMATELPVVASAVGGVPRVVDEGETGFLIESGDGEALRDRVIRLRDDPGLRGRMGALGRKIALDRYSSARMVRDYIELYQTVMR